MSTENKLPGVGGTAQDGGISTAATVADGGPSGRDGPNDPEIVPDEGLLSKDGDAEYKPPAEESK